MTKICENCFWCEANTCTNINSEYANKPVKETDSCIEFAFLPEIGNLLFGNSRGAYPIKRGLLMNIWNKFENKWNIDNYGFPSKNSEFLEDYWDENTHAYVTPVFTIRPYYWGDDDKIAALPNLVCDDIQINWYKYFDRDAYCNIDITPEIFKKIINKIDTWLTENKPN